MWMKLENIMLRRQTLGDSEGQGRLAFCGPRGHKESDMTEQLNNNKKECRHKRPLIK